MSLTKKLLTRDFFIDGIVVHGHQRGAALGLHTANLSTQNELLPCDGVYATKTKIAGRTFNSVTNIGFNQTFRNKERSIETHILEFDKNIYDKNVRLYFVKKLRDEIEFASPAALVKQIQKDIASAIKILKNTK